MLFGTWPLGRCEILDGESVRTRFLFFGPFIVPLESFYVGRESFQVQRPMRSVVLAYLRWVVSPIAFLVTVGVGQGVTPALGVVVAAWLALVFFTGRTFGDKARQRRALASIVGHGAPPEILRRGALELFLIDLERAWTLHGRTLLSWRDLYPKEVADRSLELYYALCRYDAALTGDPVMTNRARLAWERVQQRTRPAAASVLAA